MLAFETIEPKTAADASVIFLHGLGANGFDLMNIVPMLKLAESHGIRFIFPHAPSQAVTLNGGMRMPAWYDITGLTLESREDFAGLEQSRYQIDLLIEQEIKSGIKPERIMLGGFSQGGALAIATVLQSCYPLAGLIVLSSYFACMKQLSQRLTPSSLTTPILMAHGINDPVVMYDWGMQGKEALLALGFSVAWQSYPIAHEICLPELEEVARFIQKQLLFSR